MKFKKMCKVSFKKMHPKYFQTLLWQQTTPRIHNTHYAFCSRFVVFCLHLKAPVPVKYPEEQKWIDHIDPKEQLNIQTQKININNDRYFRRLCNLCFISSHSLFLLVAVVNVLITKLFQSCRQKYPSTRINYRNGNCNYCNKASITIRLT